MQFTACSKVSLFLAYFYEMRTFFFFSFGGPSPYASGSTSALWFILLSPVFDFPTFSTSFTLPHPLSRESWSFNPVIYMFPTFVTSCLQEILAAKCGIMWGREMAGKFKLKMPDFHVAFR
jgi:hypothetical protein